MIKYNFIRIVNFIFIFVLFFAQPVYDPSVYAKMQRMEDDTLADIDAAALDLDFNFNVRSVVNDGLSLESSNGSQDIIAIDYLEICNGTRGTPFNIRTTMSWDIGGNTAAGSQQTWLLGGNVALPNPSTQMGIFADYIHFHDNSSPATTLTLGNATITGVYFGQALTAPNPDLSPFTGDSAAYTAPWIIITSRNDAADRHGLKGYAVVSTYVDHITLDWGEGGFADDQLNLSGVYVFGLMNNTAQGTPGSWPTLTGMAKIGGVFPRYARDGSGAATTDMQMATVDVGSASGAQTTRIVLNTPFSGAVRVRNVTFGTLNWGPFALDDISFYRVKLTLRDL